MSIIAEIPYFQYKQIIDGNVKYLLLVNHGPFAYINELRKFVIQSLDSKNNVVKINCTMTHIWRYDSITRAVEMEGLRRISPHLKTLDTVSKVVHFYKSQISSELENIFGVIVVRFSPTMKL